MKSPNKLRRKKQGTLCHVSHVISSMTRISCPGENHRHLDISHSCQNALSHDSSSRLKRRRIHPSQSKASLLTHQFCPLTKPFGTVQVQDELHRLKEQLASASAPDSSSTTILDLRGLESAINKTEKGMRVRDCLLCVE